MVLRKHIVLGNIGSGKSTVLRVVDGINQDNPNVHVILEDVKSWEFMLKKFYDAHSASPCTLNPHAWLLQQRVIMHYQDVSERLLRLAEDAANVKEDIHVFIERSPLDAKEVFIRLNEGCMTSNEFTNLWNTCTLYQQTDIWSTNVDYYYIEAHYVECFARLQKRDRASERSTQLDYIRKVGEAYENLVAHTRGVSHLKSNPDTQPEKIARLLLDLSSPAQRPHCVEPPE